MAIIEVSLKKAHVYRERLIKNQVRDKVNPGLQIQISEATIKNPNFLDTVLKKANEVNQARDKQVGLQQDILRIKESIFSNNLSKGISQRLASIELLKYKASVLNDQLKVLEKNSTNRITSEQLTAEYLSSVVSALKPTTYSQPEQEVFVATVDEDTIRKELDGIRKEIANLEEEVSELNTTTKVQLELSAHSLEILGL